MYESYLRWYYQGPRRRDIDLFRDRLFVACHRPIWQVHGVIDRRSGIGVRCMVNDLSHRARRAEL